MTPQKNETIAQICSYVTDAKKKEALKMTVQLESCFVFFFPKTPVYVYVFAVLEHNDHFDFAVIVIMSYMTRKWISAFVFQ